MPRHEQFDTNDVLMRAMNLFWRQGYQATSMTDLAKVMGLGRASIYNEFGNKHGLFVRALRHYDKVWRENWLADLTKSSSPRQAILDVFEAAIDACLADGSRDGCLLINTALELSPHDPEVADIVTRAFTEMEAFFRTSVERGKALGEIRRHGRRREDRERSSRSVHRLARAGAESSGRTVAAFDHAAGGRSGAAGRDLIRRSGKSNSTGSTASDPWARTTRNRGFGVRCLASCVFVME